MANVSCVILNYNDANTTAKLVQMIRGYDCLDRIVVVDNASTDASYERLRLLGMEVAQGAGMMEGEENVENAESVEDAEGAVGADNVESAEYVEVVEDEGNAKCTDKVVILKAERNGGYGAGNNLGVHYCVEVLGADYVLIANPDVRFTDACVRRMANVFRKFPNVGAVAARMVDPVFKNKPNAWPLRGFWGELLNMGPISRRAFRCFLEYPERYFKAKPCVKVGAVHGSMLMVDGAAFLACGGYDENIFLYQEEAVLGHRMRGKGYRSMLLTKVAYYHAHSATIGKAYCSPASRQRLRHDSTMYYLKQYLGIQPYQEMVAKAWFAGIMAEIWVVDQLIGCLQKRRSG